MAENIFLFVPNLIGYARILLALIAFYYMRTDYVTATWCYLLSGLLDAFDGHAARMLNQGTKFGAMLDQLTDRCATMCLLVTLSVLYPDYMFWFQLSMIIDVASHWLHLHSSSMKGIANHKMIDMSGNPILRIYYTSRPVLFAMCAGNELFYSMMYLLYFTEGPLIPIVSFSIFRLILILSAPISLAKTAISLLHLITASQNMAIIDVAEREQKAAEKKE
ncbi:CDP-diacylglycerol--inositol 3-phosphatidyltransferase-like [Asterias amurensis]|uniref:CDP-diacylglycerol--inositol 3-phosphatidyltransferase-like n=1 Tax=Asterias amurensis TaxID=7602 RepID=UPI003AB28690